MTEESLFQEALSRAPEERAAFLQQACAGQPELRVAVAALLVAHERSGNLLDRPVAAAPLPTGEFTPEPEAAPPLPVKTTNCHPHAEPGIVIAGRYVVGEKQRENTITPQGKVRIPEVLERLVQLHEATDNKDDAAKRRKS